MGEKTAFRKESSAQAGRIPRFPTGFFPGTGYHVPMATPNFSTSRPVGGYTLPEDPGKTGPRSEAERRLFAMITEGIESGPGREVNADFIAELRARIPKR